MSLSQHNSRIIKRLPMPPSQIKSGMIVSCEYKNRHGQSKKYLVICINSNYKGEFHCYKLNNFSDKDVIPLAAVNPVPTSAHAQATRRVLWWFLTTVPSSYTRCGNS